eukprot:1350306-Rhodomonas_salina.3
MARVGGRRSEVGVEEGVVGVLEGREQFDKRQYYGLIVTTLVYDFGVKADTRRKRANSTCVHVIRFRLFGFAFGGPWTRCLQSKAARRIPDPVYADSAVLRLCFRTWRVMNLLRRTSSLTACSCSTRALSTAHRIAPYGIAVPHIA